MPRCWLFRMMALAAMPSIWAVASSCTFMRKEPSPSMSTTCLSGQAIFAPMRGRIAEAHGTEASGGEEGAGLGEVVVLSRPHLVLAHARS